MLTEPLKFTGTLSLKDVLDLEHYLFRYIVGWPVRILMAVISALITALFIFVVHLQNLTFTLWLIWFLCLYCPLGWILHRRARVWWHYCRHRDQYTECTVMLTNESISTSCIRADMRLNWDGVKAIVNSPRGVLFIVPPYSAWFWLPQREFDGNDRKEQILEVAREHNLRIERMA